LSPAPENGPAETAGWKQRLWAYLSDRVGLDAMLALGVKKRVPIHRTTVFYFLGGMALFLFIVQIVSGVLLSLYYKPSPDQAFESVQAIMSEVKFGWLIRSVHSWGANLVIGVLFLHLLTTYMMRAYRRPREFTWVTGLLLLALFMALGFSGYLLPWNQLSYAATNVGTKLVGVVPVVGEYLLKIARGGENVTGDTLSRFYALHVAIFPLLALALMGAHLYLVQKQGMSVPPRVAESHGGEDKVPSMSFVPDFLLRDAVGWYLALGILAALAALFPWELGEKADPFASTEIGTKPEWYFLFMFQLLKQLPGTIMDLEWLEGEMVGVLFFGAVGSIVLLVPFLDRGDRSRRALNFFAGVSVIFFIVMTAWGWFDELPLQIILGTSLLLAVLALADRFLQRGTPSRRALGVAAALTVLVLIAAIIRELTR